MSRFVSESEAEVLAQKALEKYISDCSCQTLGDVKLATQKFVAVAVNAFELLHSPDLKISAVQ